MRLFLFFVLLLVGCSSSSSENKVHYLKNCQKISPFAYDCQVVPEEEVNFCKKTDK